MAVAGVTVLLSLTVFMNIVSELMPITSDAVPLIGEWSGQPAEQWLDCLQEHTSISYRGWWPAGGQCWISNCFLLTSVLQRGADSACA